MKRRKRKNLLLFGAWFAFLAAGAAVMRAGATLPAPAGFSASSENGRVLLQWTPVPSATAYLLYRHLQAETPTGTLPPTVTPTSSPTGTLSPTLTPVPLAIVGADALALFSDSQVTNGRNYLYQAAALDGTGLGIFAQAPAVPFSPPLAVEPVTVLNQHNQALDLFWVEPGSTYPVSLYNVFRYTVVLNPTPTAGAIPVATVVYSVSTPTPIAVVSTNAYSDSEVGSLGVTAAYYVVQAVDNHGNAGFFPSYSTNRAAPVISAPKSPLLSTLVSQSATPVIGLDGYGVRLFWSGNLPIEGVTLYQVLANNTPIATIPVQTVTPTVTYDVTTIPFSPSQASYTNYQIAVFADNGLTSSSNTIPVNIYKSSVANFRVTPDATHQAVTLTWDKGSGGTYGLGGYRLYRGTNTPIATIVITPSATPTLVYVDATISNANGYRYFLEPFDELGRGGNIATPSTPVLQLAPPTVAGVTAAGPTGNNQVQVSWQQGGNGFYGPPRNYVVYRGSSFLAVATIAAPQLSYVDVVPGIAVTTAVTYKVSSVDAVGNTAVSSAESNSVTLVPTSPFLPVPNYQVTAVVPQDTKVVQVSWNLTPLAATTPVVDGFGVYRSQSSGQGFEPVATVLSGNSYEDVEAQAGKTYYYRIAAKAGTTLESPLYPEMTPDPEAGVQTWPNAPIGLTAYRTGVNQTTLFWVENSAPENVLSYTVYQNNTPTITVTPSPTMSLVFTENPGTLNSYQVVARNASGVSDPATVVVLSPPDVTPIIGLTPPAAYSPTLGATVPASVWISGLSYPGSEAMDGYTIYRESMPTPGTTPTLVAVANVDQPVSFTAVPGEPGFTNHYKVVGRAGTVLADPAYSAPLSIDLWPASPVFGLTASASAVTLAWAAPVANPVTGYTIYRNLYPTTTPVVLVQSNPPATSYVDSAVTAGTAYIYWMDAQNLSGSSELSSAQTLVAIQPPTLSLTPLPNRNQLSWSQVAAPPTSNVTGYAVYRAYMPTPGMTPAFSKINSNPVIGLSNNTYVDSGVNDTVSYIYRVAVTTLDNLLSAFSNPATITVQPMPIVNLQAFSGDQLVQLRWEYQGTPNNTYTLLRKLGTAGEGDYEEIRTGYTGTSYIDSGVINKTFYTYKIITVDSLKLTAVSEASVALPAKTPVVANAALSLAQNSDVSQAAIGNTLIWFPANTQSLLYDLFEPLSMYPLGGYFVYRSTDGGGTYQLAATVYSSGVSGNVAAPVTYFDEVELIGGPTYTYLVEAFDAPPDSPIALSHRTPYNLAMAYPISLDTALDRNSLRPFGALNEQRVNIRFVVTGQNNVVIKVFTLNGTFVKELVNGTFGPGIHWTSWDALNRNGALVASGVYLVTTEMKGHQDIQKIAVIK